jgi:hypothetical protein
MVDAVADRGDNHWQGVKAVMWPGGHRSLLDQICLDIPPQVFADECTFWAALTDWELRAGSRQEFAYLARPAGMPLRLLLQRLDDDRTDSARAHLDLATSDVAAELRGGVRSAV